MASRPDEGGTGSCSASVRRRDDASRVVVPEIACASSSRAERLAANKTATAAGWPSLDQEAVSYTHLTLPTTPYV